MNLLRYDGLYVCTEHDAGPSGPAHHFLRFYPHGRVVEAYAEGSAEKVARWLTEDNMESQGLHQAMYILNGNRIGFGLVVPFRPETGIHCDGTVEVDNIVLTMKNQRAEGTETFQFVQKEK